MDYGLIVMSLMVLILTYLAFKKEAKLIKEGYLEGLKILWSNLPLLICAFVIAALLEILIPSKFISIWLGEGSGFIGILIAMVAGGIIPAGPYVVFPLISTFYEAGASLPVLVTFIVSWALLGSIKLPFELAIVGPRFMLFRYIIMIPFPIISGIITHLLFGF